MPERFSKCALAHIYLQLRSITDRSTGAFNLGKRSTAQKRALGVFKDSDEPPATRVAYSIIQPLVARLGFRVSKLNKACL